MVFRLLRWPALVTLLAAFAGANGCRAGKDEPGEPRLVVLYATCTLSRHYLGPYNPDVSFTPALDAFAEEGTVFSRHQTESGQSGVAFASLFSGTQADRHGVYRHPWWLDDESFLIPWRGRTSTTGRASRPSTSTRGRTTISTGRR
jgi:hypothetical protein